MPSPNAAPALPPYPAAPDAQMPGAQPYPPPEYGTQPRPLAPGEVRLASPRLYPIRRPRPPRRYGDAGAPFAFGVGASSIWRNDRGYELFSEHARSTGVELFASYDVWAPGRVVVLAAGLSFRSEQHDAAEELTIAHNSLQADLTARFQATRWLWPHVRVGAGFIATRFDARDRGSDIAYEDRDRGFLGSVGGGFTLRTPSRLFETHRGRLSSLSFGVLLEGGYAFAQPASLVAKPTGTSEIDRMAFSAGELDRGGPYMRILFVVRF